ncbi:MAG: iron-containing alcohol dehydrogenase, partial [Porticoccaceae bacterium]|nr:iron-containing alcohol dehydrogenase [Porticoccaceae bacterium]
MSTQIILPRILQVGDGASNEAGSILNSLNCQRPLIVTDAMMVELGYVASLQESLEAASISSDVFQDTVPEPTVSSIQAGVDKVRDGNYDSIIAIGGGSPIDSAKAIAILGKYGGVMRDYKFPRVVNEPGLPIIAIPTTAGTGSECTKVTIITDETNDEKMLCVGIGFMPTAALVDYSLTLSLPARTTADTGIDALTHAMEAYVSKKASLYSDSQAIAAMKLLAPNLRKTFHDGSNQKAREEMMLGATLAGVAFSNASVALVHGMSRPIGAFYHVPHGL